MYSVSIITASYNYARFIAETINSVLAQTYQDWELIVVDDGSKDNSVEIIKSYCQKDSRIKLFQHENGVNKGLAQTLKLGIEKATGEWIAFVESDDTLAPTALQERIDFLKKNPSVLFLFDDVCKFGETKAIDKVEGSYIRTSKKVNQILKNFQKKEGGIFISPANFAKYFSKINLIPTFSCVIVKKSITNSLDFNSPLGYKLDRYLYAQLAIENGVCYINKKLTNWRIHEGSYTSSKEEPKARLEFDIAIIKILATQKLSFWDKIKIALCYLKYFRHTFIRTRGLKITYFCGIKIL